MLNNKKITSNLEVAGSVDRVAGSVDRTVVFFDNLRGF